MHHPRCANQHEDLDDAFGKDDHRAIELGRALGVHR